MPTLTSPKNTSEILKKYQFRVQKKYGQNFLIDANILEKIVEAAEIGPDAFVLEIGPGIGTMTQMLCEAAAEVVAVEIDEKLMPILGETLGDYDNVTVLNCDILKQDICALAEQYGGGRRMKVVANLPYYITTPIIMDIFESHAPVDGITVMVQREVAERMQAGPGTKDYGALSLAVQYYSIPEIVEEVPPSCFIPQPQVSSAVVRLKKRSEPPVDVADEELLFKLIRASFNQRRKTLANGIFNSGIIDFSKEEIAHFIENLGLRADVRGEKLTLSQFAELANALTAVK
ncbi:MAG: 16S rRNA (adenine(1518)-N(6)/adenine(1519)-N(6))-dimethyltransferase RsmA [Clostridiales bacterium]|nr:16S rRNA (adenine(1518)-N(6)/adenine(1519)-N(6))-dimethyltransferase RsmA [Clostridiales bacterium]